MKFNKMRFNNIVFLLAGVCFLLPFSGATQQQWQWVQSFGSIFPPPQNGPASEEIVGMEVDDEGNVYVAGNTGGPLYFENDTLQHWVGRHTSFLIKFDCNGDVEWHYYMEETIIADYKLAKDSAMSYILLVNNKIHKVDKNGNGSYFFESSELPGSALNLALGQNGEIYTLSFGITGRIYDSGYVYESYNYLARHDANGNVLSFDSVVKTYSGPGTLFTRHTGSLEVSPKGNVYISGATHSNGAFRIMNGDTVGLGNFGFILKFDKNAKPLWSFQFDTNDVPYQNILWIKSLIVDDDENMYFRAAGRLTNVKGQHLNLRPNIQNILHILALDSNFNVIFHDTWGRRIDAGILDEISLFGEKIATCYQQTEQDTYQYGSVVVPPVNGSQIRNTPGFIVFDKAVDDGVQHDYLHMENFTAHPSFPEYISFDNAGNIILAGRIPTNIHFNNRMLPFWGPVYDLFVAKWGLDTCPQPVQVCEKPDTVYAEVLSPHEAAVHVASRDTLWNLEYDTAGFTPGTGTVITGITQSPYVLTGLLPNTSYDVWVQDSCENESTSESYGPVSFTTPPPACQIPLIHTVDDINASQARVMWNSVTHAQSYTAAWENAPQFYDTAVTNDTFLILSGLQPETEYNVRVKARCSSDSVSLFSPPATFTTSATGVSNLEKKSYVDIYPNPATDRLLVEYSSQKPGGSFIVYSVTGEEIFKSNTLPNEGTKTLNTQNWPAGVYILHFHHKDGMTDIRKVVISY